MIRIKKITLGISLILLDVLTLKAQTLADYELVKSKIVTYYNASTYTKVYALLSAEFKRQISEEALVFFMESNLYEELGRIKSCKFVREEDSSYLFLTTFKKGKLNLFLTLNNNKEIDGLRFLPISTPVQLKANKTKALLTNNPLKTNTDKKADSLVRAFWDAKKRVGLSIGLIKAGETFTYGYGEVGVNSGIIPNKETIMEIGSITKTFAGLLVAQAVQDGKLNIQDDIRKYLSGDYPNLMFNNAPITVQHLLTHTSGLPRIPDDLSNQPDYNPINPYKNYSKQMMLDYLRQVKISQQPGTVFSYSNYGTALLSIILEQAYHKSFDALLHEKVLQPFRMQRTFIQVPPELAGQQANVYDNGHEVLRWQLGDMVAAGGLSSTVEDMLNYLTEQYRSQNKAVQQSHEILFKENTMQGTAYLWVVTKLKNGNHLIWHNGATGGSSSFCGFIPETGDRIVVLSNSSQSVDQLAIQLMRME